MYFFVITALIAVALIAVLASLPSLTIGKWIFTLSQSVECRLCGLKKRVLKAGDATVVFLDSEANKPVLLLLHGLSADKTAWLKCAYYLKNNYRVIIPDLIGHGQSSYSPNQRYSTASYLACCLALLQHLGIKDYAVAGNSMGGAIAVKLLETDTRCKKAVLIGPAGAATNMTLDMLRQGFNPFLHTSISEVLDMYRLVMKKKPFIPRSVLYYLATHSYLNRYDALVHLFDDFVNMSNLIDQKLHVRSADILMLWGEEDYFSPTTDIETWKSFVGSKNAIIYPGIGHMAMLEAPKRTAEDITSFLQSKTAQNACL